MTRSITHRLPLTIVLTLGLALISLGLTPTLAIAQESTIIKDEGRIVYAQATTERETYIEQEREERVDPAPPREPQVAEGQRQVRETERVRYEERRQDYWLWVIGRNAFMGGIVGGMLGAGAYLLSRFEWSPWVITQFAGGGILVGASVGLIEVMFRDDMFAGPRSASLEWMERDMPRAYQLNILDVGF